jgi:ABC-type nitrate/sulfonate/bicarbonate transport system permease component
MGGFPSRAITSRSLLLSANVCVSVALLAVWQACAQFGFIRRSVLPAPTGVRLVT